ncbi:lipid droplet-associated protein [Nakamurella flava]|uniref:Lipid droplet-associated protein n=1 Tax=Nakamurella flava TaxID=2576308 RepID=A0A4V6CSV2_9ACTN|nr:lipid droplet-associated protein [Nakamurella flava]TKV61635.1 lipid droplet-associated protein [Nakamurella flava]
MAFPLPLPLKIATGLVVTGVERIRSLPADLSALPVQAAGYALRVSMKVQQEIAELATKGDETLSAVFGGGQPERSPLATFDDDLPTPPRPRPRPSGTGAAERRQPETTGRGDETGSTATVTPVDRARRGVKPTVPVVPPGARIDGVPVEPEDTTPTTPAPTTPAETTTAPADAAPREDAEPAAPAETLVPADWSVTREDPAAAAAAIDEPTAHVATEPDPVVWTTATDEPIAGPPVTPPLPLPDYDQLTVAQVRGHLRRLTADDVQSLLDHEQQSAARAPFLTLLSNRLVTLQHSS